MKYIKSLLILFVSLMVFSFASAEVLKPTSDINLFAFKQESQDGNLVKFSFAISNKMNKVEGNLRYGLELFDKDGNSVDKVIYNDLPDIKPKQVLGKVFEYEVNSSEDIKKANLLLLNQKGFLMSFLSLDNLNIAKNKNIPKNNFTCQFDKGLVRCSLKSKEKISFDKAVMELYKGNEFGIMAVKEEVSIDREKNTFQYSLPKITKSGFYTVITKIDGYRDSSIEVYLNGETNLAINDLSLEKNNYKKGENGIINIFLSDNDRTKTIIHALVDQGGKICASGQSPANLDKYSFKASSDCSNAKGVAYLMSGDKILDSFNGELKSVSDIKLNIELKKSLPEKVKDLGSSIILLWTVVILFFIISIVLFYFKKKTLGAVFLILTIFSALLIFGYSKTFAENYNDTWNSYSTNLTNLNEGEDVNLLFTVSSDSSVKNPDVSFEVFVDEVKIGNTYNDGDKNKTIYNIPLGNSLSVGEHTLKIEINTTSKYGRSIAGLSRYGSKETTIVKKFNIVRSCTGTTYWTPNVSEDQICDGKEVNKIEMCEPSDGSDDYEVGTKLVEGTKEGEWGNWSHFDPSKYNNDKSKACNTEITKKEKICSDNQGNNVVQETEEWKGTQTPSVTWDPPESEKWKEAEKCFGTKWTKTTRCGNNRSEKSFEGKKKTDECCTYKSNSWKPDNFSTKFDGSNQKDVAKQICEDITIPFTKDPDQEYCNLKTEDITGTFKPDDWGPDPSSKCIGVSFTQNSNQCQGTRGAIGEDKDGQCTALECSTNGINWVSCVGEIKMPSAKTKLYVKVKNTDKINNNYLTSWEVCDNNINLESPKGSLIDENAKTGFVVTPNPKKNSQTERIYENATVNVRALNKDNTDFTNGCVPISLKYINTTYVEV